jgi:hypothetical protein
MEKTMKKMIEVKSGIEHLADKLHHLKGVCFKEKERNILISLID